MRRVFMIKSVYCPSYRQLTVINPIIFKMKYKGIVGEEDRGKYACC
jgi:hypothetical protein